MILSKRYEVGTELGSGGMGTVYKAIDTQTNHSVAIKLLKQNAVINDLDQLERFRREGAALRQLNHPNIVKLRDMFEQDDKHYLVMDYISGGDLRKKLREGYRFSINEVLDIAIQLVDALTRAHFLKIIHRDLNPGNILISENGVPHLTDFGIAHMGLLDDITQTGATMGTLYYLAPEILNGDFIDNRIDIWSLGVVLFEMLTGQRPFNGASLFQVTNAIMYDALPDLEALCPDCPVALVDLVYRMLDKDRNHRIQSIRLVGAELENIIQGLSTTPLYTRPKQSTQLGAENTRQFSTSSTKKRLKHNLPAQTSSFFGREHEIDEIVSLFSEDNARLVTIFALGGMGKSRLAIEVGEKLAEQTNTWHSTPIRSMFEDGIWFVELAPLTSAKNIPLTIATALGYQFQADGRSHSQQILDYLANRNLLLVLDNFDHLLDGTQIIVDILRLAPDVKVLVTSRERLNLTGEQLLILDGLNLSRWDTLDEALEYPIVKLFIQHAKRTRPDFEIVEHDLPHLFRIFHMSAGMPLAIILASSWLETLSLEEIADELATGLEILETELRDIPVRQRSIQAIFDNSWGRLDKIEQDVFIKASLFRGGMTRDALQTVTGAKLRTLQSLVNKGMFQRDADSGNYSIHTVLQQYVETKLADSSYYDSAKQAHMTYFAAFMKHSLKLLKGKGQQKALKEINFNFENIRVAWLQAVERKDYDAVNDMIGGLDWYCWMRSLHIEGEALFLRAREQLAPVGDEEPHPVWARTLIRLNSTTLNKPTVTLAMDIAEKINDTAEIAECYRVLGWLELTVGHIDAAIECQQKSYDLFNSIHDKFEVCWALTNLALVYTYAGMNEKMRETHKQCVKLAREIGDKISEALGLSGLAWYVGLVQGNWSESARLYHDYGDIGRELNNVSLSSWADAFRSLSFLLLGDVDYASELAMGVFQKSSDQGIRPSKSLAGAVKAHIAYIEGDYSVGREFIAEISQFTDILSYPNTFYIPWLQTYVNYIRAHFAIHDEDWQAVKQLSYEILQYISKRRVKGILWCLTPIAAFVIHEAETFDERSQAVELYSFLLNFPSGPRTYFSIERLTNRMLEQLHTELGYNAYTAAWERGEALDFDTILQRLLSRFE